MTLVHTEFALTIDLPDKICLLNVTVLAVVQLILTGVQYPDIVPPPVVTRLRADVERFGPIHVMERANEFYFTKSRAQGSS